MNARPRNRYLTLALFLAVVIFAGFAVQRVLEIKLSEGLDQPAFSESADPEAALRDAFTAAADQPRILVLLRAGSLSSEQDIEALRKFLRDHRRAPFRLIALWRGPLPLREHTTRFNDARVSHIWDPHAQLLPTTLEGTALLYRPHQTWSPTGLPPAHDQAEPTRAHLPLLERFVTPGQ